MDEKRCSKCGEVKPLSEFHAGQGRGGVRADCKVCFRERRRVKYASDPEMRAKAQERTRRWIEENQDRYRAYKKAYLKTDAYRNALRKTNLKTKYGITPRDYERMLEAQGGGCATCGRPPRDDISLHVDHDHRTGTVRGLLCFPCNNALGLLKEDPGRLLALVAYLADPPAPAVLAAQDGSSGPGE
jgi:hypothetical protein